MGGEPELLFTKGDLGPTLDNVRAKALEEVESMEPNRLLQVSETDLIDYIKDQYGIEPVQLLRDKMHVTEPQEVEIDVTGDPRRFTIPGERTIVTGVAFSVVVPYAGNEIVLSCRPQTYTLNPPIGRVEGQTLYLDFESVEADGEAIKHEYERTLGQVEEYLSNGLDQVKRHNERLETDTAQAIARRKQRLLDNQGLVVGLGLPVSRRVVAGLPSDQLFDTEPPAQQAASVPTSSGEFDALLCHASEDKAAIVEPFSKAMEEAGLKPWLDKRQLQWGDNLVKKVQDGLTRSHYVVVFLSEAFLRKRWPETELNTALSMEIGGRNLVLPLLLGLTDEELRARYPMVSAKLYKTVPDYDPTVPVDEETVKELVKELVEVLKQI